jgi:triosephosphate isomerase
MRAQVIAANWKMHTLSRDARTLAQRVAWGAPVRANLEIVLCPPFTGLWTVRAALTGSSVALGAQDVYWESQGAYTGEVSPSMLVDAGCAYVIAGHSERRALFGDTDEAVRKKTRAATAARLRPIVCVGETLAEREAGQTEAVLQRQVSAVFQSMSVNPAEVRVAYEPVWAIGTGRTATPALASQAHAYIRGLLRTLCGDETANALPILYGGSVRPDNARALLAEPEIDGVLVGGASLDAEGFLQIARAARG